MRQREHRAGAGVGDGGGPLSPLQGGGPSSSTSLGLSSLTTTEEAGLPCQLNGEVPVARTAPRSFLDGICLGTWLRAAVRPPEVPRKPGPPETVVQSKARRCTGSPSVSTGARTAWKLEPQDKGRETQSQVSRAGAGRRTSRRPAGGEKVWRSGSLPGTGTTSVPRGLPVHPGPLLQHGPECFKLTEALNPPPAFLLEGGMRNRTSP